MVAKNKIIFLICSGYLIIVFLVPSLSWAKMEYYIEDLVFHNSFFMPVEGVNLHYRIWQPTDNSFRGSVLLIHGLGGSTFSWRHVAPELAENGYLVLAVDLPGFGLSQRKLSVSQSYKERANLFWKLLENLKITTGPWNLVGHSMGGGVAMAMALQKPGDTLTLILVDSALGPGIRGISAILFQSSIVRGFIAKIIGEFFFTKRRIKSFLNSAYGRKPTPEEVEGYYQPLQLKNTHLTIASLLKRYRSDLDLKGQISEINIPTLFIWGKEDKWISVKEAEDLVQRMPQTRLNIIEEAAHCPMETHPKLFGQCLLEFLKEFNISY